MEKFLRLLNPKSINYEADRIDGGVQQLTAQDVLLAISYAKLSPLQDNLIRMKCFSAGTQANVEKFSLLLVKLYEKELTLKNVNIDYHILIVKVALTEFCFVAGDYKSSDRSRGVIAGVSYSTVNRHMKKYIDQVLEEMNRELAIGFEKISFQLLKTN